MNLRQSLLLTAFVAVMGGSVGVSAPARSQTTHQPSHLTDPRLVAEFGADKAGKNEPTDWRSVGFMALGVLVVAVVMGLWYRQLRFQEDLEGERPRLTPDDE